MKELSWFPSLSAVPGNQWQPPRDIEVGSPLSTAQPVVEELDADEPIAFIQWQDEHGNRLPDDFGFGSPADSASRGMYEASSTREVLRIVSTALSLPGMKHDYFRVIDSGISGLWRQEDEDPVRLRMQEDLALLAIALLKTGLEETVVPPFAYHETENYLASAASPYRSLIQLYQKEGFLQEAAAIYADLQELPEETKARAYVESDPSDLLAALEELGE